MKPAQIQAIERFLAKRETILTEGAIYQFKDEETGLTITIRPDFKGEIYTPPNSFGRVDSETQEIQFAFKLIQQADDFGLFFWVAWMIIQGLKPCNGSGGNGLEKETDHEALALALQHKKINRKAFGELFLSIISVVPNDENVARAFLMVDRLEKILS